jgi:hypothetical protein
MALTPKKLSAVRPDIPVAVAGQGESVRINFNVRAETRRRSKAAANERGLSLSDLIEQAMNAHLRNTATE